MYIDQHILNERKAKRKNVAMVLIDNKMAYDMVHFQFYLKSFFNNLFWGALNTCIFVIKLL